MSNYFDKFDGDKPSGGGNFFDQFHPPPPPAKSSVGSQLADIPIGIAGGVAGLINAGIGLGDIATGGKIGAGVDALGKLADTAKIPAALRPTQWQEQIQSLYSPEMKAANEAAHQSESTDYVS